MTQHNDPDEKLPVTQPAHVRQTGDPVVAVPVETDAEPAEAVHVVDQPAQPVVVENVIERDDDDSGADRSDQPDDQAQGE